METTVGKLEKEAGVGYPTPAQNRPGERDMRERKTVGAN
jgi:hypothetical protein